MTMIEEENKVVMLASVRDAESQNQTIMAIAKEMERMREVSDRIHALFAILVTAAGLEVVSSTASKLFTE